MPSIVTDILFLIADFLAATVLYNLYYSKNYNIFIVLMIAAFVFYGIAVYILRKNRVVANAVANVEDTYPGLSFWFRLSHIAGLIYLPIALAIAYLAANAKGSELFAVLFFITAPGLSIFVIRIVAKDKIEPVQKQHPALKSAALILFVYVFAFFDAAFREAGFFLCREITRELVSREAMQPAWYIQFFYRVLFIWMFYLPMRMWLFIPERKNRLSIIFLIAAIFIILLSGIVKLPAILSYF